MKYSNESHSSCRAVKMNGRARRRGVMRVRYRFFSEATEYMYIYSATWYARIAYIVFAKLRNLSGWERCKFM